MKALVAFGTRPEAVKLAPVRTALADRGATVVTVATAQHRELLEQALRVFRIVPDHDLDVMRPRQRLADLASRILPAMDALLRDERPDVVIVQGDTTSTFVCGLASFYEGISVAHVEAGLRTHDLADPFPEEMNRKLTSGLARWHFAPTARARANLLAEGVRPDRIDVTGNTVVDALQAVIASREFAETPVPHAVAAGRRSILVTLHRRESWGARLDAMCGLLSEIVDRYADVEVVFPVHLNPAVRDSVERVLSDRDRISLLEPLDYTGFLKQMQASWLVVTDSGGVQEEAPSFGKPVFVLRNVTERLEAVDAGSSRLVGTDPQTIRTAIDGVLRDERSYRAMAAAANPFGDGQASGRIADRLIADLGS